MDTIKYQTWSRTPHGKMTKKKKKNHTQESQKVSPFPGCNKQTRKHNKHKTNKNDPQKKYRLGTVSKKYFYWRAYTNLSLISDVDQDK